MRYAYVVILVLFLSSNTASGHRENSYYLYGLLGNLEVGLQLDEFGDNCFARYFSMENRYDKVLEGRILPDSSFELFSYIWDPVKKEKVEKEYLFLKEIELDIWEGKWKGEGGVIQNVYLKRIELDSINHPFARIIKDYRISTYAAYRTRDINFVIGKKEKIGKKNRILHVTEAISGISFFRLPENKEGHPTSDSINKHLLAEHIKAVDNKYSCVENDRKGDYSIDFEVDYLNARVISYRLIVKSSCYGGYEEKIVLYNTLSLSTSKKLMLEDIFWFGDNPKPELQEGEADWYNYRYNVFAPKVMDLLSFLYPDKFSSNGKKECAYSELKLWQFPKWYLTRKGLYLGSQTTFKSKECDLAPWSVIPYKDLKHYSSNDYGIFE